MPSLRKLLIAVGTFVLIVVACAYPAAKGPADAKMLDWRHRAGSPDARVRRTLVEELWRSRDRRAIDILLSLLGEEHTGLMAANALAQGFDHKGIAVPVGPVIEAMGDADPRTRKNAAYLLRQMRNIPKKKTETVFKAFLAATRDPDPYVRREVYGGLGHLRNKRATQALARALEIEIEPWLRRQAARALRTIADKAASTALAKALKDKDAEVRGAAAYALTTCGDGQAVEALIAALKDPETTVRGCAAFALGSIRDGRAVKPLVQTLDDSSPGVRQEAARSLGWLKAEEGVPKMIKLLAAKGADDASRKTLVEALGEIGDRRATEAVLACLVDSKVSEAAIASLRKIGDPKAVMPLAALAEKARPPLGRWAGLAVEAILHENRDGLAVTDPAAVKAAEAAIRAISKRDDLRSLKLYAIGLAIAEFGTKAGQPLRRTAVLYRRREGKWRLVRELWTVVS